MLRHVIFISLAAIGACNEPSADRCPSPEQIPEELGLTPRADENLEMLALDAAPFGTLMADQATYDRIVHDVTIARGLVPELADVTYAARTRHALHIIPKRSTLARFRRGEYHDLDCFLDVYGGEIVGEVTRASSSTAIAVRFEGIFDHNALLDVIVPNSYAHGIYGSVTGPFDDAGGDLPRVDGPSICLNANDATWHYVFVDTDGPCPGVEHCADTTDYYVTSSADGSVTVQDSWHETASGTPPAWTTTFRSGMCGLKREFPLQH